LPNCSIRVCMLDSLQAGGVSILVGRRTLPQTKSFWAPTRKDAHQTTLEHVMSACRTQSTASARRPAQLRRQASRFTMLRLLALALCGESVLQSLTTTVAESGSCEQPALFAIALHGQSPRARESRSWSRYLGQHGHSWASI
jgi:hypothetical protein